MSKYEFSNHEFELIAVAIEEKIKAVLRDISDSVEGRHHDDARDRCDILNEYIELNEKLYKEGEYE